MGDCRKQILYNDFHYGCFEGIVFQADQGKAASGTSLGLGIDGAMNAMIFEALDNAGFNLINSQLVALEAKSTNYPDTRYLGTSSAFTGKGYGYEEAAEDHYKV